MAEGNFFTKFFGLDNADSKKEKRIVNTAETNTPETSGTTLQDAVNFVAELQSYYYNDICKMQTDFLLQTTLSQSKINFINKKIKQDQVALAQIDEILNLVKGNEREYQSVWKKSVYSFYDEIEKAKLEAVQTKIFTILVRLCEVNTKPELDNIILNRIESYRQAWNINIQIPIPKNNNAILVDENDSIESYRFGNFCKQVYADKNDKVLSSEKLNKIRVLKLEFENTIPTDSVWVYISSVTRFQLNYMRRTCIIDNDWEYNPNEEKSLTFEIVNMNDLEQYLKGILQIVLTKKTYAVISIIIPSDYMVRIIGPTLVKGEKIEIRRKNWFYLQERSGLYKDNLMTVRIDRRNIPEKLQFVSYLKFRKDYF
ncbi:MAG: hypothetical protein IJE05_03420 [Clostridia bacterium]|nr:hypothetical protein [Clostridia bacterium]